MRSIYIRSAELGAPFTDRPTLALRDNMLEAANRAILRAGLDIGDIDALYVAAMGSFTQEQFMGALPLWLAGQLGLSHAYLAPMLSGSSETGAWALRSAFEVIRRGDERSKNVLVVAGEQMNPLPQDAPRTPEGRIQERRARNQTIAQVVDEVDRCYGLNMLRLSDLIMDTLAQTDGLDPEALRQTLLPFVSLEKYRRVRRYPYGQFAKKGLSGGLADYMSRPMLTPYFRLDDVAPTTTGAVAVVLSANAPQTGPAVQILGMGQGFVPSSMMRRRGPAWRSRAIRDALRGACADARVNFEWLLDCDFACIHDAFPVIEYFFLRELGLKPEQIFRRMISGWSNPLGGLRACGHALGASGLLQVAKTFHLIHQDSRYLETPAGSPQPQENPFPCDLSADSPFPGDLRAPPYRRCFTTSVGGALTNVLVTVIQATTQDATPAPAPTPIAVDRPPSMEIPTLASLRAQMAFPTGPTQGQVLARTQLRYDPTFGDDERPIFQDIKNPWIYLVSLTASPDASLDRTLAYSDTPYAAGDVVSLVPIQFEGQVPPCMKITGAVVQTQQPPQQSPPQQPNKTLSATFLDDLNKRLSSRHNVL